jgi:hypothetical protein
LVTAEELLTYLIEYTKATIDHLNETINNENITHDEQMKMLGRLDQLSFYLLMLNNLNAD